MKRLLTILLALSLVFGLAACTISVQQPQGTYMLFLQCEEWCRAHGKTLDDLLKAGTDVGVAWQDGRFFEDSWGIRMNLALPLFKVKEAFERLNKYVFC